MSVRSPWLPYHRPDPRAELRLFCFAYAGGGASVFNPWRARLPAGVELCAVQLPGRETRLSETPFRRIEPLVEAVEQGLRPYFDLPFLLFGHSMGARVAFELCRSRRRRDASLPVHLIASGCRAPQIPRTDPHVHALPDDRFAEEVLRLGGVPAAVFENPELRELFVPILKSDFAVVERYEYREDEPLATPITAFGGTDDPKATRDEVEGWRAQTTKAFATRVFEGGHFFLQSRRDELLETLRPILAAHVS